MSQTRLFVGNLPNDAQDTDLRCAFANYGEVVNLDIKSKSDAETDPKKFAFITISGGNNDVESCIKYFSSNDFKGSRLYVTRARESFLERLQRERALAEKKADIIDYNESSKKHPTLKLGDKLNPRKRKVVAYEGPQSHQPEKDRNVIKKFEGIPSLQKYGNDSQTDETISVADKKKQEADKKRIESLQKKRQEFKNKQKIIKTGLIGIDKVVNKKTRFSDNEEDTAEPPTKSQDSELKFIKRNALFNDDDESDGEVNFEIKKQFEGKKGQKVLDLQSRYKSDRRFVLDERFIEEDQEDGQNEDKEIEKDPTDEVEISQDDEKSKQFKILEDVLGVAIKTHVNKPDKDRKVKPNMGMIRFDPMNPDHAKFVVPIEDVKQESKKTKKNKAKQLAEPSQPTSEVPKVEVSKEQFYKSEITKEAFLQPAAGFSLRSLFGKDDQDEDVSKEQENNYTPLPTQKQQKVKNPLDPGEKNPFVYDSSESEDEGEGDAAQQPAAPEPVEVKAVWRENLFFTKDDSRLTDGLGFFNNSSPRGAPKERRELKSVMMKRIHNTERKKQMFKRKIGGRKKSMKKSYKKKS